MIFEELFLRSQNHDCLGQILSFLICNDLANVARTCKVLQETIFEADQGEGNVNLIWQGAEEALTNPSNSQSILFGKKIGRTGANAREHCHLFALASKAAKACELSDEIEEKRIKVDGVLVDLMNVRGFDADGVAEKKADAANETRTLEEASQEIVLRSVSDEEREEMKEVFRKQELRLAEKWENLAKLTAPTKTYHHDIFVRITRTATGEVISEGFCSASQTLPWYAGLEWSRECCARRMEPQTLQLFLSFESLGQSGEIQNFLHTLSTSGGLADADGCRGINVTAVVIDRRNHSIQCLFQQDQAEETRLRMVRQVAFGEFRHFRKYEFSAEPRWSKDSIQLGPSISRDLYFLDFDLCLFVAETTDGSPIVVPVFEVHVREDESAWHLAFIRRVQSAFE